MSVSFSGHAAGYKHSWVRLTDEDEGGDAEFEHPLNINLGNSNARALLGLLGIADEYLCDSRSVAEFRRALMFARNTLASRASNYTREEQVEYGQPRDNEDGSVELRPVRLFSFGIDEEYLEKQVQRLSEFVEYVAGRGATEISWG